MRRMRLSETFRQPAAEWTGGAKLGRGVWLAARHVLRSRVNDAGAGEPLSTTRLHVRLTVPAKRAAGRAVGPFPEAASAGRSRPVRSVRCCRAPRLYVAARQ